MSTFENREKVYAQKIEKRNQVRELNNSLVESGISDRSQRAEIISKKFGRSVTESTLRR